MTLISMSSHSFQQAEQMEARTFSFTARGRRGRGGRRVARPAGRSGCTPRGIVHLSTNLSLYQGLRPELRRCRCDAIMAGYGHDRRASAASPALYLSPETLESLEAKGYTSARPTSRRRRSRARSPARTSWSSRARAPGRPRPSASPSSRRWTAATEAVQAVVLAPTRELAIQVAAGDRRSSAAGAGVKVESVYGGDSMERQLEGIRAGAHVIAGTPGRVLDHLRRGTLDFSGVHILVLDEADRMLDMGFAVEMGQIMEFVPAERQTLLFSATVPDRHPRPHLPLHGRARVGAALRGPDLRQGGRAPLLPDPAAAQGGDALQAPRVREPRLLDDLLQHARGDAPGRRTFLRNKGLRRGHALVRPAAEEARAGDGPLPRRARSATSSRPTSPRAASTSRTSRTSSSSRRPTRPSSTSTARAARAAWARAAAPSA